jgi:hypothetical protein
VPGENIVSLEKIKVEKVGDAVDPERPPQEREGVE